MYYEFAALTHRRVPLCPGVSRAQLLHLCTACTRQINAGQPSHGPRTGAAMKWAEVNIWSLPPVWASAAAGDVCCIIAIV